MEQGRKTLIIGKGKTGGKVVELLPTEQIIAICDSKKPLTEELAARADVAIIFVSAPVLTEIMPLLLKSKLPVICATTGLEWKDYSAKIKAAGAKWIVGSNFSAGMNMMFFVARQLSRVLRDPGLVNSVTDISIKEAHHVSKLDSPSGTSLRLKELVERELGCKVPVEAERVGDVAGIHQLHYKLLGEELDITHIAHDRKAFAQGAINAVSMLDDLKEPGLYYFDELLFKGM